MDVLSIATGIAAAGVSYFLYRCARDGVPAVVAWTKAKWSAGTSELAALNADIDHVHERLAVLERTVGGLAGEVARLKGAPAAATAAQAAPSFLAAALAAQGQG
jgi:hypothetical protein